MIKHTRWHSIILVVVVLGLLVSSAVVYAQETATPEPQVDVVEPPTSDEETTETPSAGDEEAGEEAETPIADTEPLTTTVAITTTAEITATTATTVSVPAVAGAALDDDAEATEEDAMYDETAVVAEEEPYPLQITVYNLGVGLVKDVRSFDLDKGLNELRFSDVASGINARSVQVVSLTDPQGVTVLEQNYEYDIVSSQKLLQKYVDQEIALRTENGESYSGTLLSGASDVVLQAEDGIKVIKIDQIQEFAFPELPEGLITRPTLMWLLRAADEGEQELRVTYQTSGIDWNADYVAVLDKDDAALALNGWITVDNNSGTAYKDAKLKLVAGDINRVREEEMYLMAEAMPRMAMDAAAAPQVDERSFFEYHLYDVQRPVTLRENQTKQIEFATAPQVSVNKVFLYQASPMRYSYWDIITDAGYGTGGTAKVKVMVEFKNDEESGLGLPLPKGTIRVYKEDVDGGAELVGEDSIDHTPKDEELTLYLGDAFDVVGERTQTSFRKIGDKTIEESYRIELRNHKAEDITVLVRESLFRSQDAEIIDIDVDYEMADATTMEAEIEVEADASAEINYTVRYIW